MFRRYKYKRVKNVIFDSGISGISGIPPSKNTRFFYGHVFPGVKSISQEYKYIFVLIHISRENDKSIFEGSPILDFPGDVQDVTSNYHNQTRW